MIMYKKERNSNFVVGFNTKNCSICGKIYKPNCSTSKYCGAECRRLGRNNTNKKEKIFLSKKCFICNRIFTTTRSFQKVCSCCKRELQLQSNYPEKLDTRFSRPGRITSNVVMENFTQEEAQEYLEEVGVETNGRKVQKEYLCPSNLKCKINNKEYDVFE
jgi:hypothetical protein